MGRGQTAEQIQVKLDTKFGVGTHKLVTDDLEYEWGRKFKGSKGRGKDNIKIQCMKCPLTTPGTQDHTTYSNPIITTWDTFGRKKSQGCQICSGNKYNTRTFIEKAKSAHGNTYNYSKSVFTGKRSKLIITCSIHGDFEQIAEDHYTKSKQCGCKKCGELKCQVSKAQKKLFADEYPDIYEYYMEDCTPKFNDSNLRAGSPNENICWRCPDCDMIYNAAPKRRAKSKCCPYCAGKKVCDWNSLGAKHPEIAKYWSQEHNYLTPFDILPNTHTKYWWKCDKGHIFEMSGGHRVCGEQKCGLCFGNEISEETQLTNHSPEVAAEWHPTKNGTMTPNMFSYGERYPAWWKCSKGHEWKTRIDTRCSNKRNCPNCNPIGYSKAACDWMNELMKAYDFDIQHMENGGEYIDKEHNLHFDGYCAETNTVHSFHGCFWHGCQKPCHNGLYTFGKKNDKNHKDYQDLYEKTLNREELILSLGYNLITKWECE
jgi:hypothetical protein